MLRAVLHNVALSLVASSPEEIAGTEAFAQAEAALRHLGESSPSSADFDRFTSASASAVLDLDEDLRRCLEQDDEETIERLVQCCRRSALFAARAMDILIELTEICFVRIELFRLVPQGYHNVELAERYYAFGLNCLSHVCGMTEIVTGLRALAALVKKAPVLAEAHAWNMRFWVKQELPVEVYAEVIKDVAILFGQFPSAFQDGDDLGGMLERLDQAQQLLALSSKCRLVLCVFRYATALDVLLYTKDVSLQKVYQVMEPMNQAEAAMELVLRSRERGKNVERHIELLTDSLLDGGHLQHIVKLMQAAHGREDLCKRLASRAMEALLAEEEPTKWRLVPAISESCPQAVLSNMDQLVNVICSEREDMRCVHPLLAALFKASMLTHLNLPEAVVNRLLGFIHGRSSLIDTYNVFRLACLHGIPCYAYTFSFLVRSQAKKYPSADTTWLEHLQFISAVNATVSASIRRWTRESKRRGSEAQISDDTKISADGELSKTLSEAGSRINDYASGIFGDNYACLVLLMTAKAELWTTIGAILSRSPTSSTSYTWISLARSFLQLFHASPLLLKRLSSNLRAYNRLLSQSFLQAVNLANDIDRHRGQPSAQAETPPRPVVSQPTHAEILSFMYVEASTNFIT